MDQGAYIQQLERGLDRHIRLADYQATHINQLEQQRAELQAQVEELTQQLGAAQDEIISLQPAEDA